MSASASMQHNDLIYGRPPAETQHIGVPTRRAANPFYQGPLAAQLFTQHLPSASPPLLHFELPSRASDPYRTFGVLGQGAYGYVDKVHSRYGDGRSLARKLSILPPRGQRREAALKALREEARIAASLRGHPHIVNVVETFQWGNRFGIIMSPVAQGDLAQFLEEVDQVSDFPKRNSLIKTIPRMCGCLIRALDYVHCRGVRHKDIKPSNILLHNGEVILTDFGIARDMSQAETTGTTGDLGPRSKMYCAPEANHETGRRGRSADIFSLGCVILELITVFYITVGGLQSFKDRLRTSSQNLSAVAYSDSKLEVLRLLCHLRRNGLHRDLVIVAVSMLHPNPLRRPTSTDLHLTINVLQGDYPVDWCRVCSPLPNAEQHWEAFDKKSLRDGFIEISNVLSFGSPFHEGLVIADSTIDDLLVALGWTMYSAQACADLGTSGHNIKEHLDWFARQLQLRYVPNSLREDKAFDSSFCSMPRCPFPRFSMFASEATKVDHLATFHDIRLSDLGLFTCPTSVSSTAECRRGFALSNLLEHLREVHLMV